MAFATGVLNAVELTTASAIPFAFDEMAELVALTISGMLALSEPVQEGLGIPSSAAASWNPYWVGTKNGLVVTWLTKANFHGGVDGKFPAAELAVLVLLPLLLVEEQAASSAEAAAVALTRPVPVSSFRRVGPSFMLSVWIASSTFGSTSLIAASSHIPFDTERLRYSWAAAFLIPCIDTIKRPAGPPQTVAPDSRTARTSGRRTGPSAGVSAHTVERYGVVTPKARSSDHGRQRRLRHVVERFGDGPEGWAWPAGVGAGQRRCWWAPASHKTVKAGPRGAAPRPRRRLLRSDNGLIKVPVTGPSRPTLDAQ